MELIDYDITFGFFCQYRCRDAPWHVPTPEIFTFWLKLYTLSVLYDQTRAEKQIE